MGSKGNNRHIKRLASSKYIHVDRKVQPYVSKPNPGRHTLDSSISISTALKEKLAVASNAKEAKLILKSGNVQVNGKVVKDTRYPLGFGDLVHFKPSNESFAVSVGSKGVVKFEKVTGKEHAHIFKVVGKYLAKGNKDMIRLHDGTVMPSSKEVKVNDSVHVKEGKVHDVLKLQSGARCLVVKGLHASESGVIKEIKVGTALRRATVSMEGKNGLTETLLDNVMVIGAK